MTPYPMAGEDLLRPLARLMDEEAVAALEARQVGANELPEPSQHLLVHGGDMTSRLMAFHEARLRVAALASQHDDSSDTYSRKVTLVTIPYGLPVEYGAITIHLRHLNRPDWPGIREKILAQRDPLGALLTEYRVPFVSEPRAYISLRANQEIAEALHAEPGDRMYARRNVLRLSGGPQIADIVEIVRRRG